MNEEKALNVLARLGVIIIDSHVVYTSRKHGTAYVNKDALYTHTAETSRLCHGIAEQFTDDRVDVVIAPAIGGVILSQWIAYHLIGLTGREVRAVYAEKEIVPISDPEGKDRPCYVETGKFVVRRGYDTFVVHKNVLVVEDVLTTGGSARKVVEAVRAIGGNVIGLGALVNRGEVTPQDVANTPKLFSLVNVKFDAWDEADCTLCKRNVPINTDVGKGYEFLARKGK